MQNNDIRFSVVCGPEDSRLTKRFRLDDEGQIHKESQPFFANGTAETKHISKLSEIENIIDHLDTNQCISTGTFDIQRCEITTTDKLDQEGLDADTRSRSKDCMTQPSLGLVLLDHDPSPWMPEQLRCNSPAVLVEKLTAAIPAFESVAYSGTGSCSTGIYKTATNEPYSGGGGLHVYTVLMDADIDEFQHCLEVKLWNAGLGFLAFARNGAMLPRTLIDLSVLSTERLIYEATPVLGEGLSRKAREWQHREGSSITGDLHLSVDEIAEYERRVSEAKADPRNIEEAERLQDAYYADRIRTVAKQKSITEDEAQRLIPRQSIADRESAERQLHPDDVVEINGKHISVAELLEQGAEFDGTAMPDPVEGRSYGLTTAKFYYNDGKTSCVHSFAHGLSITYRLSTGAMATTDDAQTSIDTENVEIDVVQPLDPSSYPHRNESRKGNIFLPATIQNIEHMLKEYGIRVQYDVIKKKLEITIREYSTG